MTSRACDELHELASAYALDALPPDEATRVEAYLALSPALAEEVRALREAAAALAHTERAVPSPALRARLLSRVAATPQAAPRDAPPAAPAAAPVRDIRSAPSQARRVWLAPALGGLAAASLLVAVTSRGTIGDLERASAARDTSLAAATERLARREAQLNTVLEADANLKLVLLAGADPAGPGIQFFWNAKQGRGIIHAFRLPPAPAGKTYQFWVIRDGRPMSVRVFDSDPDGHAMVEGLALPASWDGVTVAAVTLEPAGGSPQPTTTPFLVGTLGD